MHPAHSSAFSAARVHAYGSACCTPLRRQPLPVCAMVLRQRDPDLTTTADDATSPAGYDDGLPHPTPRRPTTAHSIAPECSLTTPRTAACTEHGDPAVQVNVRWPEEDDGLQPDGGLWRVQGRFAAGLRCRRRGSGRTRVHVQAACDGAAAHYYPFARGGADVQSKHRRDLEEVRQGAGLRCAELTPNPPRKRARHEQAYKQA